MHGRSLAQTRARQCYGDYRHVSVATGRRGHPRSVARAPACTCALPGPCCGPGHSPRPRRHRGCPRRPPRTEGGRAPPAAEEGAAYSPAREPGRRRSGRPGRKRERERGGGGEEEEEEEGEEEEEEEGGRSTLGRGYSLCKGSVAVKKVTQEKRCNLTRAD